MESWWGSIVNMFSKKPSLDVPAGAAPVSTRDRLSRAAVEAERSADALHDSERVTEELFQYETMRRGDWLPPVGSRPSCWESVDGERRERDDVTLPRGSWHWVGDWHVDDHRDVDVDGWEYAPSARASVWHCEARRGDRCRRRRWIRLRRKGPTTAERERKSEGEKRDDEHLDALSDELEELRHISSALGDELDVHNAKLEELEGSVDATTRRTLAAKKRARRLMR
eukprot:PLAT6617.1.p1 GENE.PLAT6617.1~~PLAT6617.1.p1  ORF type:complete len:226 (-),score=40.94 PLAT6617.1:86-763(-)